MRAQKSNLGKSYFIQLLIQRENLSGAQLAKRLRGGGGKGGGGALGKGTRVLVDAELTPTSCRPQTDT